MASNSIDLNDISGSPTYLKLNAELMREIAEIINIEIILLGKHLTLHQLKMNGGGTKNTIASQFH